MPDFDTDFAAEPGRAIAVAPGITRVTAPNAGPFTFTGTNSYVLGEARVALLDPGPDDAAHRAALIAAIAGRPLAAIILTHTHRDHSAGAPALQRLTGAPLWSAGPHRPSRSRRPFEIDWLAWAGDRRLVPDRWLSDGEQIDLGGLALEVVATPGHCANHLAFGVVGSDWLLSGDHVMGWSSTLIAAPDGALADYLASLEKLIALAYAVYLPGHGGPVADGRRHARALLAHRQSRNRQIVAAVADGAKSTRDLLDVVYPTLKGPLRQAAAMTLGAHIDYLAATGALKTRYSLFGARLAPAAGER